MQLRIVSSIPEFLALRQAWDSLTSEPLSSFDWHFAWWKSFGSGSNLHIYVMEHADQVVGIAPFFVDVWMGQSRLRLIGSGKTCTDYGQLIVRSNFGNAFATAIANDIVTSRPVMMVEFEGTRANNNLAEISQHLNETHWRYDKELEPTWVLELGSDWDEFVQTSNKSLRRKIRKAIKRLESGAIQVSSTLDGLDFDSAFETLVQLHQLRFNGKGEPGVFHDPRFTEFLRQASRALCQQGRAEIIEGTVEGSPIVSQFYLLSDEGPQLYQAGICPGSMKFEPGHTMFTFATRTAIAKGYTTFDFLRGDEPYKPYWGAQRQSLVTTRYVSKNFTPTAINQAYLALRSVKHNCSSLWSGLTAGSGLANTD